MIATFLASIGGKIIMGLLLGALAVGGYAYWRHVEVSRAVIALQRDQLVQAVKERDEAIADRNRLLALHMSLPEVRRRLCAQRGPTDGCCTAAGECRP